MTIEERIIETEKKLARIAAIASGTEEAPLRADVGCSSLSGISDAISGGKREKN